MLDRSVALREDTLFDYVAAGLVSIEAPPLQRIEIVQQLSDVCHMEQYVSRVSTVGGH